MKSNYYNLFKFENKIFQRITIYTLAWFILFLNSAFFSIFINFIFFSDNSTLFHHKMFLYQEPVYLFLFKFGSYEFLIHLLILIISNANLEITIQLCFLCTVSFLLYISAKQLEALFALRFGSQFYFFNWLLKWSKLLPLK